MLLSIKNRRVYYDLAGPENGPVVVFAHSLASDSGMWSEQLPSLFSAGYRALRIDMRGHGGTETTSGAYAMDQLADDVAAAASLIGIERFHFIGLSIGGMIGQGLGIRHGGRLKSLMLCDTNAGAAPNAKEMWQPRVDTVKKNNSCAAIADDTMKRWFSDAFLQRNSGRWKQIRDTIAMTDPKGYENCIAAITSFDWRSSLPKVATPTLCLCGSLDPSGGPAAMKPIVDLIPGARYEEIAGALHLPNVERPDLFNALMIDWLKAAG